MIFNFIKKDSIFIDCSSVDYKTTLQISDAFTKKSIKFIDAPVSGGVSGAEHATLTIMVGVKKNTYNGAKEILNVFCLITFLFSDVIIYCNCDCIVCNISLLMNV